jgi:hypothetical protein
MSADTKHLSLKEAEALAELQAGRTIALKFRKTTLLQFWNLAKKKKEFSVLSEDALSTLLHFSITYLCEQGFSGLAYIKIKNGRDFFLLLKNCGCVCLRFDHVLNNCTKVNKTIFLTEL